MALAESARSGTVSPGGKCDSGANPYEELHGVDEPSSQLELVRAGPLTALLEGTDLRRLRVGGVEVVRRLTIAVRDRHWNTLPNEVDDRRLSRGPDRFLLEFDVTSRDRDFGFRFHGRLSGAVDGTITYSFDGEFSQDSEYARIGICVLHPIRAHAGQPFSAGGRHGSLHGRLPDLIGPQRVVDGLPCALFPPYEELTLALSSGGEVSFAFSGDAFEMEDQRNWTDASFKSYSTPLSSGTLHRAGQGDRIRQSVRVRTTAVATRAAERNELRLGRVTKTVLPPIGFCSEPNQQPPSDEVVRLLQTVAPDHIRTELDLRGDGWRGALSDARDFSHRLGCPLELAVFADGSSISRFDELSAVLRRVPLSRVLVFAAAGRSETVTETTPSGIMAHARAALHAGGVEAPVGGGTDMYFAELNRTPPDAGLMDCVAFAVVPQVHVEDDLSLFETLEAQEDAVRSGLAISRGRPLVVGPITLRHRKPFYGPPRSVEGLPFSVDVRQMSRLLAAWTLGSVKACAEAGAASLTYFETTGPRGLLVPENREPCPCLPAHPGMVFPVYQVFKELGARKGARIVECASTDPLEVVGFGLVQGGSLTLLVANLTVRHQRVWLPDLGRDAAIQPVTGGAELSADTGRPGVSLEPYSVAALHSACAD